MVKNTIVDAVADAVVRAELAIVRTGRQAVQAVNRRVAGKKKTVKKAAKKAASKTKRAVRKVKRVTKKAVKKAAKRGRRR